MPLISCDEKGSHLCPLPPKAHPPIMGKTPNDPKCGTVYKTPDQHPSKLSGHQRQESLRPVTAQRSLWRQDGSAWCDVHPGWGPGTERGLLGNWNRVWRLLNNNSPRAPQEGRG